MKRMNVWLAVLLCLLMAMPCAMAEEQKVASLKYGKDTIRYILLEDGTAFLVTYYFDEDTTVPTRFKVPSTLTIGGEEVTVSAIGEVREFEDGRSNGDIYGSGDEAVIEVDIPFSIKYIQSNIFHSLPNLKTIYVAPDHDMFALIDGVLFEKANRRLVAYPRGFKAKSYTIPQGIEIVGASAFEGNVVLTEIIIPNTVKVIDEYAFWDCDGLTAVTFPESVTTIGEFAFRDCDGLTAVTFSEGLTTIGEAAFYLCEGLTAVTFSEGLTTIGKYAFGVCSGLTTITLPASVTEIGESAFPSNCVLRVERGSYAARWAMENNYRYEYTTEAADDLSWLTGSTESEGITTDTSWLTD